MEKDIYDHEITATLQEKHVRSNHPLPVPLVPRPRSLSLGSRLSTRKRDAMGVKPLFDQRTWPNEALRGGAVQPGASLSLKGEAHESKRRPSTSNAELKQGAVELSTGPPPGDSHLNLRPQSGEALKTSSDLLAKLRGSSGSWIFTRHGKLPTEPKSPVQ